MIEIDSRLVSNLSSSPLGAVVMILDSLDIFSRRYVKRSALDIVWSKCNLIVRYGKGYVFSFDEFSLDWSYHLGR